MEACLVLRAEDQEMQRAIINNNVVVINDRLFDYDQIREISYDSGEKLYFSKYINDKRIYDEQLINDYHVYHYKSYRMLVNRLQNKHLLDGLSQNDEQRILEIINNLIGDKTIKATIKYKWDERIVMFCKTGILSLKYAEVLENYYERKRNKDNTIYKCLKKYIKDCRKMLDKILQLSSKLIYISDKIVEINRNDVIKELIEHGKYCSNLNEGQPDIVITGINDEDLIAECKSKGIKTIPALQFRIVKDAEKIYN